MNLTILYLFFNGSQVFQYRQPLITIPGPQGLDDDSDDDFAHVMAARRARQQAAGAENVPMGGQPGPLSATSPS